jgi:hypothetical protein
MLVTPWFCVEGGKILAPEAADVGPNRGSNKPRIRLHFSAELS